MEKTSSNAGTPSGASVAEKKERSLCGRKRETKRHDTTTLRYTTRGCGGVAQVEEGYGRLRERRRD